MAYLAFSLSTIAGLLISSTFLGKRYNRALTLGHEAGSVVGLLLLGVHAWAILNDSFFTFTWRSLVVPGQSPYAPLPVGIGVVAAWLSAIVVSSFYVRKRIGPRTWRRLHYITPVIFVAMTVHGVASGTDTLNPLVAAMYTVPSALVVVLVGLRIAVPKKELRFLPPRPRKA